MKVIVNKLVRVYRPVKWKLRDTWHSSANSKLCDTKDPSLWFRHNCLSHITDIVWHEDLMTISEINEWNKY